MTPYIRELTPTDAAEYRRLRVEASADPSFASSPGVEEAIPTALLASVLGQASSDILGAFDRERLLGMVGLGRSGREDTGTLFGLFVTAAERNKGIGRLLVRALLARVAGDDGICNIELLVRSSNGAAMALYEAEGFTAETEGPATLRMRRPV